MARLQLARLCMQVRLLPPPPNAFRVCPDRDARFLCASSDNFSLS